MAKKILVVDDDELVLIAIRELLTPVGFFITMCSCGTDALQKVANDRFDLVILDVIMPEMDGFEVCRRIRQIPSYDEAPIMMLTAKSGDDDKKQGMEVGANLYLPKPISPKRLIALVKEAMK